MAEAEKQEYFKASNTADVIVFNIHASEFREDGAFVNVVLVQRKNEPFQGQFALPGGFLDKGESLEQCAIRELKEETGIETVKGLLPIGTFSNPDRDPRGPVISTAYAAVVPTLPGNPLVIKAGDDAADCQLFRLKGDVKQSVGHDQVTVELKNPKTGLVIAYTASFSIGPFCLPVAEIAWSPDTKAKLAFDHAEILARAITKMPGTVTPTKMASRVESDATGKPVETPKVIV